MGFFFLDVDNDAFANASPENPIYIRFNTAFSNGWSKTLVDLRTGSNGVPINLAISPANSTTSLHPGVPPTAVQLVRLIKGETQGWIRVTYSSSVWIDGGSGGVSPSEAQPVTFGLGLRGGESVNPRSNTSTGGNEFDTIPAFTASTVLFADYRETPSFGEGTLETLDFQAYDSTSRGIESGSPIPGAVLSIAFSNDNLVARGVSSLPCLEYHFQPDDFESVVTPQPLSRFDLVGMRTYGINSPPVYISNTSDFPWQAGTRLFLVLPEFNVESYVKGWPQSTTHFDSAREILMFARDVEVSGVPDTSWEVNKIMWGDSIFAGYEIVLKEGEFPVDTTLQVDGLYAEVDAEDLESARLSLELSGYYRHQTVTDGEFRWLHLSARRTFDLEASEGSFQRQVLPYTAFDETEWKFQAQVVNTHAGKNRVSVHFYNRHGILLRVFGPHELNAFERLEFDLNELFGPDADRLLAWVELLSEHSATAVGIIEDEARSMLDIYSSNDRPVDTLYGAHLPAQIGAWETKALVVSTDLEKETSYFLQLPGAAERQLSGFFFPGGTAVLDDEDFVADEERSPWFQVQGSSQSGAGLLYYFRKDRGDQLVSTPLNVEPQKNWRYDHVGDLKNLWWNGLVILNQNDRAVEVTVRGFGADNQEIESNTFSIAAKEKFVNVLTAVLPYFDDPYFTRIEVVSNVPVVSFLLMGQEGFSVLTAVNGNIPTSAHQMVPYAPRREDGFLGLAVINPWNQSNTVEIGFYRADGSLGETRQVNLAAYGKQLTLLQQLVDDPLQYSHLVLESSLSFRTFALAGGNGIEQLATVDAVLVTSPDD
ncbi:hypothetical protein [Sulfidibacter corallicola]|uniref:Uncharacterized protein n=1 Tax=Sulfidibacter corallicola TaxID=2818388 RepID=A0A8A4TER8_SULCO|nr:hypothetical protein [Sulfidibacter corallicola]QTD47714.1 hypothetical protein J3U87_19160 [Sulfidibacter corallicola]